jgi:phage regulator Rha-like protein
MHSTASLFAMNHKDLRHSGNLNCSPQFRERNFASFKINDLTGESTSHVLMTKDGFSFLVMGFTGRAATAEVLANFGENHEARSPELSLKNEQK